MEHIQLDSRALRVLAHPLRARLLSELRQHGPATATQLAERLATNTGATSYHLRKLAEVNLVVETGAGTGKQRFWAAGAEVARLVEHELADDPDAAAAASWLRQHYLSYFAERMARWEDERQHWPVAWQEAAHMSDALVTATAEELDELMAELESVLRRFMEQPRRRAAARRPAGVGPALRDAGRPGRPAVTGARHDAATWSCSPCAGSRSACGCRSPCCCRWTAGSRSRRPASPRPCRASSCWRSSCRPAGCPTRGADARCCCCPASVAVVSMSVLVFADTFAMFAVVYLLQGVYRALDSGPLEAWYVDATLAADPDAKLERGLSAGTTVLGVVDRRRAPGHRRHRGVGPPARRADARAAGAARSRSATRSGSSRSRSWSPSRRTRTGKRRLLASLRDVPSGDRRRRAARPPVPDPARAARRSSCAGASAWSRSRR